MGMRAWPLSRTIWIAAACLGAVLLVVVGTWHAPTARSKGATAVAASGIVYHGVNQTLLQKCIAKDQNCLATVPGLVQCLRVYRVCNQVAAVNEGVLSAPVKAGSPLLTARQALSAVGASNPNVKRATAIFTTYGTLHTQDAALAANDTIAPSRPVYLVTEWFTNPVLVSPPVPDGAQSSWYVTSAQYVVDAATGQVTDWGVTK